MAASFQLQSNPFMSSHNYVCTAMYVHMYSPCDVTDHPNDTGTYVESNICHITPTCVTNKAGTLTLCFHQIKEKHFVWSTKRLVILLYYRTQRIHLKYYKIPKNIEPVYIHKQGNKKQIRNPNKDKCGLISQVWAYLTSVGLSHGL